MSISLEKLSLRCLFCSCSLALLVAGAQADVQADPGAQQQNGTAYWEVSTWVLSSKSSQQQYIDDVIQQAKKYNRIEVVGAGPFAGSLTASLQTQVGNQRVTTDPPVGTASDLMARAKERQATLVIRVTAEQPKPMITDEQSFVAMGHLHEMAETVDSGLMAVRAAEGILKDARSKPDPMFRKIVGKVQGLFGDWTSRDATGVLKRGEQLLKYTDHIQAAAQDLDALGHGQKFDTHFVLLHSETVGQLMDWATGKATKGLLKFINSDNAIKTYERLWPNNALLARGVLGGFAGALGDTAQGVREHLDNGHFTIDEFEHYSDAVVRGSWFATSMLLTDGNVAASQRVGDAAVSFAQTARWATERPTEWISNIVANKVDGTRIDDVLAEWHVAAFVAAKHGVAPPNPDDYLRAAGINPIAESRERHSVTNDDYTSAGRMAENVRRQQETRSSMSQIGQHPVGSPSPSDSRTFSPPTGHVGGVMLTGTAKIPGADDQVDLSNGGFSLVVDGQNAAIDDDDFDRFVTALWAVYFCSQAPGISIDPIAPNLDRHMVRYIGQVINSDLGRVMREADYHMKKVAMGIERPDIPGFKTPDDWMAEYGQLYLAYRRFWFVPEDIRFREGDGMLLYDGGGMRLKTELMSTDERGTTTPADDYFTDFYTSHYDEFEKSYPIYGELFEYAKMVALGRYLKTQGVPLLWFLLANRDRVLTEDSPSTVLQLAAPSKFPGVTITGGVDLSPAGHYIQDATSMQAIAKAMCNSPRSSGSDSRDDRPQIASAPASGQSTPYSAVPQASLTNGFDDDGFRYATDAAFRMESEPALELVRYFDWRKGNHGMFGTGWDMLLPYRIRLSAEQRTVSVEGSDIVGPAEAEVVDMLRSQTETLDFNPTKFGAYAFVPQDGSPSKTLGLFVTNAGASGQADDAGVAAYRLADKLGNEFMFDQRGLMTGMTLGREHRYIYTYARQDTRAIVRPSVTIQPVEGSGTGVLGLPAKMVLQDMSGVKGLVLTCQPDGRYLPDPAQPTSIRAGAFLTNGGFVMEDDLGDQVTFAPEGAVESISFSDQTNVVQSLRYERVDPATGAARPGQDVDFEFFVDLTGAVRVGRAKVTCHTPAHTTILQYEYDSSGWLVGVTHEDQIDTADARSATEHRRQSNAKR